MSPAYLSCNEYSREAGEGDDNHMEGVADEILGAEWEKELSRRHNVEACYTVAHIRNTIM